MINSVRYLSGLVCCLLLLLPLGASAQDTGADSSDPQVEKIAVPSKLASPRATMATFLHSMNDIKRGDPAKIESAVTTLDLSDVNSMVRAERGEDLAWMLLEVLDRTRIIVLEDIPESATGNPYVVANYENGMVKISRLGDGRWLFDRETIEKLPKIMDQLASLQRIKGGDKDENYLPWHLRLRQQMPESMKNATGSCWMYCGWRRG